MRFSALALALLTMLAAAACRRSDDGKVVLEFWGMGREGEVVGDLIQEFERLHPEIEVVVQQIPWRTAHEKILTAYAGRRTPDVGQIGNSWIPELAMLETLRPLDALAASSREAAPREFFPGIWATNVVDGVTYGIPWYVDTRLLFYRSDLLRAAGYPEPPRTWSEWRTAMRKVKAQLGEGHFATLLPTDEFEHPVVLGMQAGAPLLRDNNQYGDFSEPHFAGAFRFYTSLFQEGLAPVASNAQIGNLYQQFAEGHFAMYVTGPWNLGEFRNRMPVARRDDWETAPFPVPDGSPYPGASFAGGSSLSIFRSCRHPREAWQLIEFLSRAEQQKRFWELTGDLPARKATWEDPRLAGDRRTRAFHQQLQRVRPTPMIPEWQQIALRLAEAAQQAIHRVKTPEEALADLDRDVDQILEKRRWILTRQAGKKGG